MLTLLLRPSLSFVQQWRCMAYYEALASSAPRKINLTKIDQIGYDLLLVGRNLFCFPLLLDIKFAVLFRERVLVWRGKRCVCGNPGEVQHARGGRKRQKFVACICERVTHTRVGGITRKRDNRVADFVSAPSKFAGFFFYFSKSAFLPNCVSSKQVCLSVLAHTGKSVGRAHRVSNRDHARCRLLGFLSTSICRKKKKFLNRRFFCFAFQCFCSLLLSLYHFLVCLFFSLIHKCLLLYLFCIFCFIFRFVFSYVFHNMLFHFYKKILQ